MFKNPFSFEGRIRRLEYGLSYIIYMIACVFAGFLGELFGVSQSGFATVIFIVLFIPLLWFMFAQGAKRCHDRGNSGIWQIIPFYHLWMIFADGEVGDNEYGPNPKGLDYKLLGQDLGFKSTSAHIDNSEKVAHVSAKRMSNLDELLKADNVNDSIIEIDNFIGNLCNYTSNMEVLTTPQRKFYLNQNLEREVNNGGFWQYFMNSSGEFAPETVLSLKEIGAVKTAEVLQRAIALFPDGDIPTDRETRQTVVNKIDPNKSIWEELDERFMNYQEDLNDLNIKFVAKHTESF